MFKILIVDDNDNNRLTINLLLEEVEDIEVYEAEDGQVAVEMCEKEQFDLIFMDIMMPNMDGFEATKLIKQAHENTMIIALSALDDQTSKNKMLSLGAEDYLTKPVNARLFELRIVHYLKIIMQRNKKPEETSSVLNPFNTKVFSRSITFRIDKEEALGEFWDYWLKGEKNIVDLSDCVRLIYGFSLWLLKYGHSVQVVVEESNEKLYMMLLHVKPIKPQIIKNILFKHFTHAKYILAQDMLSFQLDIEMKKAGITVSDEAKKILSKSHNDVTCAREYIENTAISFMAKIDGLEEINDAADKTILAFEKNPTKKATEEICENFQEYATILEELIDFAHLGFAIRTLVSFLSTLSEDQFDEAKVKKLSFMLLNLLHDLASWRDHVFITQVARDIHYLDASLLSSCIQIEAIFEDKSVDVGGDDDLEFF